MLARLPRRAILVLTGVLLALAGLSFAWSRHGSPAAVASYADCATAGYPITDTDPPSCSDGHSTWTGPANGALPSQAPSTSVPFDILVEGDSAGDYPHDSLHIQSDAEWQKFWREVHDGLPSMPPILPVNFRTSDVVAVVEGRQTTGGYGLRINSISTSAAGTVVDVQETVPTITCAVTQSPSNRYFLVRTDKLTEPVSFRLTTEHRECR